MGEKVKGRLHNYKTLQLVKESLKRSTNKHSAKKKKKKIIYEFLKTLRKNLTFLKNESGWYNFSHKGIISNAKDIDKFKQTAHDMQRPITYY